MSEHASFVPIDVELRDGRRVRLREIRPDDHEEVRQAFARLSSESRYMRFMSSIKELSPQMLDRAVHLQRQREVGLVAETDAPDGIDIVGGARYYIQPDVDTCEFAVTVVDGWQRVGLASRLMRELVHAARERGLRRMEGFVLAGNTSMLHLAPRRAFTIITDPNDVTGKGVRLGGRTASTAAGRT